MFIKKVLNANSILAEDQDRKEFVYFGKGIGYGKKAGDQVLKDNVNQVFIPIDNNQTKEYLYLLDSIPPVFLEITQEIVKHAEEELGTKLNLSIYFTLSDHLNFAVERLKNDINITNRVFWEIKNYYPKEFSIGEYAIKLLKRHLGVVLPKEEAANIAFHLINAQTEENQTKDGMNYAKLIGGIVNFVRYSLGTTIDTESVHYQRFITHVKFFVERYFEDSMLNEENDALFEQIVLLYPKAMEVAFNVKDYIEKIYSNKLTKDELTYLAVHINRLLTYDEIDRAKDHNE
ncbi:PRD domain-containing protein [Enterococcus sp. 669A]|uniref:PRD domain-containing protein n=1 Tax=Candidatus Enterococcus moelleringii TaxID=2815325 RepID=A0ABS3L9I5_9ENTE|nr:PRD domain-containing protein [Enterococcus sp. 669A]MBO1306293.1 PRD domain-containing protein [Enterococcus sp. 669A]